MQRSLHHRSQIDVLKVSDVAAPQHNLRQLLLAGVEEVVLDARHELTDLRGELERVVVRLRLGRADKHVDVLTERCVLVEGVPKKGM